MLRLGRAALAEMLPLAGEFSVAMTSSVAMTCSLDRKRSCWGRALRTGVVAGQEGGRHAQAVRAEIAVCTNCGHRATAVIIEVAVGAPIKGL